MPIVVDDNIPDFLREFLTSQGVISVRDTETGETGFVPAQPRRRPRPNTGGFEGGDLDDPSLPEGTGSVDIFDTLKGLLSSDNTDPDFQAMLTDVANQGSSVPASVAKEWDGAPYIFTTGEYKDTPGSIAEDRSGWVIGGEYKDTPDNWVIGTGNSLLGPSYKGRYVDGALLDDTYVPNYDGFVEMRGQDFYDRMSQPQSLGNSILDGAVNLFSGFGQLVEDGLGKIGGLFSGGISNPLDFDFDYTPSISDRYGPMGPLSAAATALSDPYLSTSQKVGQTLGGVLGAGASAVIPGASLLGLLGVGLGRMGAHHDFDPSTDYNLNFDTRSGRTDWGSLSPGAGGVQYGSLKNENMIEDLAEKDPDFEIQLDGGKGGVITAQSWVDVTNALKNDPFAEYIDPSEAYAFAADAPGNTFQSFGGGTLGEALTEYGQTGTGAFMNEAGSILGPNAGYTETKALADRLAEDAGQGGLATSGLFDTGTSTGAGAVSDIASGVSSYTGADIGTDTSGPDMSTDEDMWDWDFDL